MTKKNARLLNEAFARLAALMPDGELMASSFPADFIDMVTAEIKALRDKVEKLEWSGP